MEQTPTIALEPFADRVFLQRDETADKTAGGVVIPENDKEKPNKGIVVSVGPECKWVYVGQRVIFGKDYGFELQISGQEVTVLREGDIYAGEVRQRYNDDEKASLQAAINGAMYTPNLGTNEALEVEALRTSAYENAKSEQEPYIPGQFDNATRQQKAKQ